MAQIDVLATMGEDALGNHFSVTIPTIEQLQGAIENLTMRILTIDIPDRTISTYDITKRGITRSRPSGVSEQDKEVTFSFRADKYYNCYKRIMAWMKFIQDNESMAMASDSGPNGRGDGPSSFRYNIIVSALNNLTDNATNIADWVLRDAYPTSCGGISFDESNGEPIECEVTLSCGNISYPVV